MSTDTALPQSRGPLVRVQRVNYAYPGANGPVPVLRDVTFTVAEGELVAVLGVLLR